MRNADGGALASSSFRPSRSSRSAATASERPTTGSTAEGAVATSPAGAGSEYTWCAICTRFRSDDRTRDPWDICRTRGDGKQLMADLREDLARSASEVRETHISWVFLGESTVLKVKKPVNFGFLDFSNSERRRQACLNEVQLNARLAPGVYLGVVPITRRADGVHEVDGAGPVVDWAVQMRRLADAERADLRLATG